MIPWRLQRYVLREIVEVVAVSAVALTAIFFIGLSVSYARNGLSVAQLYYVVPFVLMLSLPYALPAAFLLGTVLVFGRLSGRREIDAMRASGVNLYQVILAPLALALAVCGAAFLMNQYLFPWTMAKVNSLVDRLILDVAQRYGLKQEFEVKPYLIYIGGADARDYAWKNVAVIEFAGEIPKRILVAKKGLWRMADARTAVLELSDVGVMDPRLSGGEQPPMVSFNEVTFRIPLGAGPNLNRPKFLPLGPLLEAIKKRELKAETVLGKVPGADHPRSAEWKIRMRLQAAEEEYQGRLDELTAGEKVLEAARAAVEKEQTEAKTAQAACDAASRQRQDAQALLAGQPEYLKKLESDIQSAREEGVSGQRLADLLAERKRTADGIAQLNGRIAAAEKQLQASTAALAAAGARLQAAMADCAKAQAACDAAMAAAQAAEQARDNLRKTDNDLKAVEDSIEAESEFNFRNAGALTCLVFALVGIPLGILTRRGTVLIAVAVSFAAILFVHYPLLMVGDTLADDGYLAPWIANWMADGVMGCLGLALLFWGVKR